MLKPPFPANQSSGLQTTYKELKHRKRVRKICHGIRLQTTYKELKLLILVNRSNPYEFIDYLLRKQEYITANLLIIFRYITAFKECRTPTENHGNKTKNRYKKVLEI